MNNETKINKLKDLQSVRPLVIETEKEVIGFSRDGNNIVVNIKLSKDPSYGIATIKISDLIDFKEESWHYFSDHFYYRAEINEMLESYIAERAGDYKIEKEA